MIARLRFVSFIFFVGAIIFVRFDAAHADWWECFPVYGGEWNNACETEVVGAIFAQDSDPKSFFCEGDFDDTCDAWCGFGNVVGDTCYSDDDPQDLGGGWYRDTNFFIRCACSEVRLQPGQK